MPSQDLSYRILRYPLDLTGQNPDNFVEAEVCELPNKQNRAVVLSNGPFFSESLVVYDHITGERLVKREQYIVAQLVEAATVRTGKEVCAIIIVIDPAVSNNIRVDYQCVGGPYIMSVDALADMIEAIDIDSRPIVWAEIIGKPDYFPAGHHLHDSGDVFGFEYMVLAIEEVRKAILMGDVASHDEIRAYIDSIDIRLTERMDSMGDELQIHLASNNNPHHVTKAQVGLGSVENYGIATQAEALAGTSNVKYMTPIRVAEAINHIALTPLNEHIARINNPHSTTKTQVGLGSVENYGIATQAEALAGTSNTKYTTPLRVMEAITQSAINPLNAHIARVDNPHNVTAAQINTYIKSETDALLNTKLGKAETAVNSTKLEGYTRTEVLTQAYNAIGSMGKRNLHISTVDPTSAQGAVGDIWFKY